MPEPDQTNPARDLYRLSVEEYDRIVRSGALRGEDRVELIDGFIVQKDTRDRSHPLAAKQAMLALLTVVPPGWHVASERPVVTSSRSKPEPDLAVVKGEARDFLERDITAVDVALVVKIAQSRLECDRTVMAPIYAASGIPTYWILNVAEEQIEVYSNPASGHYQAHEDYRFGQEVPLLIEGTDAGPVPVTDVLP